MNETTKILFAGAVGALAALGIQAAAHAISPKPVVHYYAAEPESPEAMARIEADRAASKAARKAATQAFIEKCATLFPKKGGTLFVTDGGAVACEVRGQPPEEWIK